jgi:hypothetical protein
MPRNRTEPAGDALQAAINQLLIIRDSCRLYDEGGRHQFLAIAVSLRAFCHNGKGRSLLHTLGESGRLFPSSVTRELQSLSGAASDHFVVQSAASRSFILPRLELQCEQMILKKFKHWWSEIIVTDTLKRRLSRGSMVLSVANHEGGAHFSETVDELYDDFARHNGLGLFSATDGAWKDYGPAPIQAAIRQIAHEFLLGMKDWIKSRYPDWNYTVQIEPDSGLALLPGMTLHITPVQRPT